MSTQQAGIYRVFWDFYGPDAQRTAEHFERHLRERIERDGLSAEVLECGVERVHEAWSAAWFDAPLELAQRLGGALRAKRSLYRGPLTAINSD